MAILETKQAARGTDPDGLQETPPVESAHSVAAHLRRHHGRHTEALSRFLGCWHDAMDEDAWADPSWQRLVDLAVA